jgi:alpha-beta hydrolase superfamily lysophospholipase
MAVINMENQKRQAHFKIEDISSILWGTTSDRLVIAVHGDQSHKSDKVISLCAEEAAKKGYQTLSFDLPEHGDRQDDARSCNPQNSVEDLKEIMEYARKISSRISLFGCSIGAYFGMLAYEREPIRQALFLSPVVNMKRIIDHMMISFGVSEEELRQRRQIATPVKTLDWDYYSYVLEHPVQWNKPTALLCGAKDNLCTFDDVNQFSEYCNADMTVLEDCEHYFHTDSQLAALREWLQRKLL